MHLAVEGLRGKAGKVQRLAWVGFECQASTASLEHPDIVPAGIGSQ